VKYHFKTHPGIDFLTQEEADRIAGQDADYHRRDLFETIKRGDYPSWTLKMQIMPFAEAETYRFNPFDLTKVWPQCDYPLHEVGRLRLDRNPTDFHTEIEQAAFEPNNLVPGIGPSPGKMLLARLFSYADAGGQLQADSGQPALSTGAQLQQRRADAGHKRLRPRVRPEFEGRPEG
jgi:catalase